MADSITTGSGIFLIAFKALTRFRRSIDRGLENAANALLGRHFATASRGRVRYESVSRLSTEASERWTQRIADHALTIVVVSYKQPAALDCLLASLRCQTLQNFDLIVLHDGADEATTQVFNAHAAATSATCRYIETELRHNDYGHSLRDIGISRATGEFVLITNGDNYYSPRLTEFVFGAIAENQLDMVTWDIVHSHQNPGENGNPSDAPFQTYPIPNRIDIGAFLVRTIIAKSVGFRDRSHDGDAIYVQDILGMSDYSIKIGKIGKTLMVHN